MEESDNTPQLTFQDYLPSAGIVGAIFALISSVISLGVGYMQISSEPTGSLFSPLTMSSGIICLITIFAGLTAVWHFTREVSPALTLGQGAVIGFLTGAAVVLFSSLISQLWMFIDPDYTQKLVESTIANVEMMELPSSQKNDLIDTMAEGVRSSKSFGQQVLWGVPITGILNLLTGLIGVKVFGEKEDEETF